MTGNSKKSNPVSRWFQSNSNRVFILYPIIIILFEILIRQGHLIIVVWGLPLLLWGYLQFRLSGNYRNRLGGGGPGLKNPPERLVTTGIFAWTRNPMYLGHFIYIFGLAMTFQSLPAMLLLFFSMFWYQTRVYSDEDRLTELFGAEYEQYMQRVKRWIPGLF